MRRRNSLRGQTVPLKSTLSHQQHYLALKYTIWQLCRWVFKVYKIMTCWKHYFHLFFQLVLLGYICIRTSVVAAAAFAAAKLNANNTPKSCKSISKCHYNTTLVFAVTIRASTWSCWQIFSDCFIVKEWIMQETTTKCWDRDCLKEQHSQTDTRGDCFVKNTGGVFNIISSQIT